MKVKTRQTALISLGIMLIGFATTLFLEDKAAILLLQSGFEAGLVGGLADWFAVTALFRHPLGIPIPHTAILPGNRERITAALVSTVENDLLNKESIIDKAHQMDIAGKLLNLCEKNIHSEAVKSGIIHVARSIVHTFPTADAAAFLKKLMDNYLNQLESEKLLDLLMTEALQNNYDQEILDMLIEKLEELVAKEAIQREMGSTALGAVKKLQIHGLMQVTVNTVVNLMGEEKIGSMIQDFIILTLKELKKQGHPSRLMAINAIQDSLKNISKDESTLQKLDAYKFSLSEREEFDGFILKTLRDLQGTVLDYLDKDSYIEENVLPFLQRLMKQIAADSEMVNKLEGYIQDQISDYIDNNHEKIGTLVRENIDKFDNETLINLIEDKVGDDLQWIRINGAICGFLIGLVLGVIKFFIFA